MSNLKKRDIDNALRVVQFKLKLGMIGNKVKEFDMSTGYNPICYLNDDCGSVGCIGGYAEVEMGLKGFELLNYASDKPKSSLDRLFYPSGYGTGKDDDWQQLGPKKAVKAIQNYLNGKADPWKGVAKRNTNKDFLEANT